MLVDERPREGPLFLFPDGVLDFTSLADMTRASEQTMSHHARITRDPTICAGQPVVRGIRVLVSVILGCLAHGESFDTILRNFPSLTEEDLRAVVAFAAGAAAEDLPAPAPLPPELKGAGAGAPPPGCT